MSDLTFDVGNAAPFHVARDAVSLPVIRRWCDAMGYDSPVHLDPVVAESSRFGRIVAPLAMLDTWTNPGLAYKRDTTDPRGAAYDLLDRQGYTSAVAVTSELRQLRPLVLDDLVRSTLTLESVGEEKPTALGPGRFVTTRQDFLVDDEPVGSSRFTVLKFHPGGDARTAPDKSDAPAEPESAPMAASTPTVERDDLGTVRAASAEVGMMLQAVSIPTTTTLIVAGAVASGDFFEPHHDRDAAQEKGSRDVFINIHTTLGLVERCVGGWVGPNAIWRSMSVRLGVPNHPGDVMTVGASFASVDPVTGASTVEVRATNGLGVHASGRVDLDLPL